MDRSRVKKPLRPSLHRTDHGHQWELLINFFLIATAALFLYIAIAYFITWYSGETYVSRYHMLGMLFLAPSSHLMRSLTRNFERESDLKLILNFFLSLVAAVLFLIFQWLAWDDKVQSSPESSPFIFFLSVAHGVYVLLSILCTIIATFLVARKLTDPIKRLIFYTNGYERMKLNLLARVWLFLNVMWAVILAVFLFVG